MNVATEQGAGACVFSDVDRAIVPLHTTWADMAECVGPVVWDWPLWLVRGLLTIVAGEPSAGKSALALRLAASYVLGLPWPDGTPIAGPEGSVLWCEAEAAQAVNLARAREWGLPLERILTPLEDPLEDIRLDDAAHRQAIDAAAHCPDVRCIVFDSLSGGNRRDENSSEILESIRWLAELARDSGKPILLTHHLRKRGLADAGERIGLDRLRGSSTIVQMSRVVWALDCPDAASPDTKRLSVIKSNLARFPEPIGLKVTGTGVTFVAAPDAPRTESQVDKARDLLLTLLARGPRPSRELEEEARGAGISWDTMNRAKDKLGIVPKRDGRSRTWSWALPARAPAP